MITKVSEITVEDIADFIRLNEVGDSDQIQISTFLNAAKDYIKNYTGLTDLDEYSDLVVAVFALCQDMYDNRTMYVDKSNMNKVVENILDMHTRINL